VAEPRPKEDRRDDKRTEPFKSFEDLTRKLLKVPKGELDEKRTERERERRAG